MNMRVTGSYPAGLPSPVDKRIGDAFPIIEEVYKHLKQLKYLAENSEKFVDKQIEFRANTGLGVIEWRYNDQPEWLVLVSYEELTGAGLISLEETLNQIIDNGVQTLADRFDEVVKPLKQRADKAVLSYPDYAAASAAAATQPDGQVVVAQSDKKIYQVDLGTLVFVEDLPLAALAGDTLSGNGVILVNGALKSFYSVQDAVSAVGLKDGDKVQTFFYKCPVQSLWSFTTTAPSATTFNIQAVGGYLTLLTPTFAAAGIEFSESYNATVAWSNRNVMMRLMRDTRFESFKFGATGKCWILGSVCPSRRNIHLEIDTGVVLVGKYSDESIPESETSQLGGMLDMVIRDNYPTNHDCTGRQSKTNITLNGSVGTIYDSAHPDKNNNNPIGYYQADDCSVRGLGGVSGSDHRGINFDGNCDNCVIDVAYATGTMSNPFQMHLKQGGYGRVRVGRVFDVPFGALPTDNMVVNCTNGVVDVEIGKYKSTNALLPGLVSSYFCDEVRLNVGSASGLRCALRGYETKRMSLSGGIFTNTTYLTARAGVNTGVTEQILIRDVKAGDASTLGAVLFESNQEQFDLLSIHNCDFKLCGISFDYMKGVTSSGRPTHLDICENKPPAVSGWKATRFNKRTVAEPVLIYSDGGTQFDYNLFQPDWNFMWLSVRIKHSGISYMKEVCVYPLTLTTSELRFDVASGVFLTIQNTGGGGVLTIATSSGAVINSVFVHN